MPTTITLDPATRLEGHLKVQVESDGGKVTLARSSGMMFRGFENLLIGKDPRDAAHITQRVCGVCPTSHAMAACLAMEAAAGLSRAGQRPHHPQPDPGRGFPAVAHPALLPPGPAQLHPGAGDAALDARLHVRHALRRGTRPARWSTHYLQALAARRQAHEMGAIFGGRMPHTVAYEFGGVTTVPTAAMIDRFRAYLNPLIAFIDGIYLPDVDLLARSTPTTTRSAAATATCSPSASST